MRKDLAKLVTEAERSGSSNPSKKYGGRVKYEHEDSDYNNEFGGFRSSARRRQGPYHKEFSDVLSPLRGVLRKNVGRPWDDVYSEFCQFLDRRSMSGIHIFDGHLIDHEVEVRGLYVSVDGNVRNVRYGSIVTGFYVHPFTGILCYKKYESHRLWRHEALIASLREGNVDIDGRKYRLINDCWFEVWTERGAIEEWHDSYTQNGTPEYYAKNDFVRNKKTGKWGYYTLKHSDIVTKQRSLNRREIATVKAYRDKQLTKLTKEISK